MSEHEKSGEKSGNGNAMSMNLMDKITAAQRRNAASSAPIPRERRSLPTPRSSGDVSGAGNGLPSSSQARQRAAVAPAESADGEYKRQLSPNGSTPHQLNSPLNASPSTSRQRPPASKRNNPDLEPVPMRARPSHETTEHSEVSAYAPRGPARQLFNPRRDDPLRFVLTRPSVPSTSQQSSVIDQSSISSYTSSTFTLTSASSQSSAPPDHAPDKNENGVFIAMLKKVYREISDFEKKLSADEEMVADSLPKVTMLKPGELDTVESEDPWRHLVDQHKHLAELYHGMLTMVLRQSIPTSMHSLVSKYNMPTRLWTNAFHRCLETLRRASIKSPIPIEHMTDFIYWGYRYYESLLQWSSDEGSLMAPYKGFWMEALGDLARCRMLITARPLPPTSSAVALTVDALPPPVARIDDTQPPSVGCAAAAAFELEPERETWRRTAQNWYAGVLKDVPGTGRLQHHLGMLSREVHDEELQGVYHLVKRYGSPAITQNALSYALHSSLSMTASNGFPTARETILPLFSSAAQTRRNIADASGTDLFVLLHGMIFTHIQVDDFKPTLARFLERLQLDGALERDWAMMGVINIGSLLEYGRSEGLIKSVTAPSSDNTASLTGKKRELVLKMDSLAVSDTPPTSTMEIEPALKGSSPTSMDVDLPIGLQLATELTFETLSFCLQHPFRRSSAFVRPMLNPYLTLILTFLSTVLKHSSILSSLERSVPWGDLIDFLATTPKSLLESETKLHARLTASSVPLPEDWCVRGMEWCRRVFERGFWKTRPGLSGEMDVLQATEIQEDDGIIEDEDEDTLEAKNENNRRWIRIIRACFLLSQYVPGFEFNYSSMQWELGSQLKEKVERWADERRLAQDEEDRRRRRVWDNDEMDIDLDEDIDREDDEWDDDPQIRTLQERRRYLRDLQKAEHSHTSFNSLPKHHRPPKHKTPPRPPLKMVPGYTVLVMDTNILLSSLSMFTSVIESERWTVVVPLAVVTELDGLSSEQSDLGSVASAALKYLTEHVHSHSSSLKIQTSRGNYLSTLSIRSEQLSIREDNSWERNMDDLILKAALWQESHWANRSAILRGISKDEVATLVPSDDSVRVVLLSLDRNLRLKARARQLHAADERDLAQLLVAQP